jgi:hypothetical protein
MHDKLSEQLLKHVKSAHHILECSDFTMFDLLDNDSFIHPSDIFRKGNDILAATYCHLLPLYDKHGFDAIGLDGSGYELKLAYININEYSLSSANNIIRSGSKNTLDQTIAGHYKIYKDTAIDNYKKRTVLVLVSEFHKKFITGFVLEPEVIPLLLPETPTIQKKISLAKFREFGIEINSCIPNFGFNYFIKKSKEYLAGTISADEYLNIKTKSLSII